MAFITVIRRDMPYKKLVLALNIDKYHARGIDGDEAYLLYALPDSRFTDEEFTAEIIGAKARTEKFLFTTEWRHNS